MRNQKSKTASNKTVVVVLSADPEFMHSVQATFATAAQIDLRIVAGTAVTHEQALSIDDATVVVVDLDIDHDNEMVALQRLMARIGDWPPVVVVTQTFDKEVARQLMQMRIADFLVKPVQPVELVRTCARVVQTPASAEPSEAEIFTYLSAVGGAGVTTLAIQTALLLLNSHGHKARPATCLVDLDFQHGACADYLDLEPRLDLREIEPRPERLDRQLLEVMTSYHASGLAVVATPNRPAEMRSFDPDLVTRLLDLVSSHFNYVVIDMPRTWFSWTDSVLLGSNRLFVVSEMTVPGLKHAKHLVAAIRERLGDGPRPQVIINRFEQSLFGTGLRKSDIEQALGDDFLMALPNNYSLVREAIDRGVPLDDVKPGNKISAQLKKMIAPLPAADKAAGATQKPPKKLAFAWARS
jgi:pilus assembly protein CpaE